MRTLSLVMGSCLLSMTGPGQAQETVPDYFEITDLAVNGDGCPTGTVDRNVAEDKQSFSLNFRDYIAEAGPSMTPSDGRKSCQLTITLRVPQGWRFAVAAFDYRGYMYLDTGISAEQKTTYYFQAADKQGEFTNTKTGPEDKAFYFNQQVKVSDKIWSPCDTKRAINIKTAIRVWNNDRTKYPNAQGVMGTDSIVGSFHDQKWQISWGKCP